MEAQRPTEHAALVALLQNRPNGLRWADIASQTLDAGSALEVWHRNVPQTLLSVPGQRDPLDAAADQIAEWNSAQTHLLAILDDDYPSRLREIHQAPPVLFARGHLSQDDHGVCIVGSRKSSPWGLEFASEAARVLASEHITVVSGLAAGIDTAAHTAALDAGGRTVAVIGTGIGRTYPAENASLQAEIGRRGLVLSQFWPDAPPRPANFLMRNATMSGYGSATVVVEAGETSGARAQARIAVEHGRPVILTSFVVEKNDWASRLLDRPGVHVASTVDEVVATVRQLSNETSGISSTLSALAAVQP